MIPDYQTLMLPVLQAAKHDAVSISDVIPQLADEFGLTDAERAEMLPSGRITLFANRVHWAKTYLKQAGLIQQPRRAYYEPTDRGRKALESNPSRIDNAYLSQFPEFIAFKTRSRSDDAEPIPVAPSMRESRWGYDKTETARLGAQCAQWILTRGKEHDIRLARTRNYIPNQTAIYAEWLLFQEDELACQFLMAFPRFQIPIRLERLQHERQIIVTRMEERLQRGGFDIGKHPPEQRRVDWSWIVCRQPLQSVTSAEAPIAT